MWKSVQEWKEKEHAAGYISGQKDGYASGQKTGYAATEKQMVLIMLKKNQTAEAIHELTDIPLEKIYEIQREQQRL